MLKKSQYMRGNAALIVLLLVLGLGATGYYFYSTGKLNLNLMNNPSNGYVLPTTSPSSMPEASNQPSSGSGVSTSVSTSDKISLTITSPLNGVTLNSTNVTIKGKTSPNAEVFINDASTKADANGNFSLTLTLDEGENNLVITANDTEGNVAEGNLSVNIQTF